MSIYLFFLNFSSQDFVRRVDVSGVLEEFLNISKDSKRIPKPFVFSGQNYRTIDEFLEPMSFKTHNYYKNILFFTVMAENSSTKFYS